MVVSDAQPIRRLVHVCTDAGLGAAIAPLAGQAGLVYRRVDNAFAACLELLRGDKPPAILLIALDGLARVEADLLTWSRSRWADLPIWVHGSTARLNGHLAAGRVKLIPLAELPRLLAGLSQPGVIAAPVIREPRQPAAAETELPSLPADAFETPASEQGFAELRPEFPLETPGVEEEFSEPERLLGQADEPVEAGFPPASDDGWLTPDAPSDVQVGEGASDEPTAGSSQITEPAEPVSQKNSSPPLRLRPLDPADRAVLTPEELAALLGPEGIHGG